MSTTALDGASQYLNNLLLARGLLRDGKAIEFAQLATTDPKTRNDAFDSNATTARIINLVHDLILRRDRDAEQREALATTIKSLRAEESQRLLDFQRQQNKNAQLRNDLSTSEAQQRTSSVSARRCQAEAKELREQTLKMKSTLDQVRAKCVSDIQKRDVELEKLRNHLSGLNRGKKDSFTGGTKTNTNQAQQKSHRTRVQNGQDDSTSQWSLDNETSDFLAAVVNETSTENVALRKIVGDTMSYLRTLTGLDDQQVEAQKQTVDTTKVIGIPGQYRDRSNGSSSGTSQSESLIPVQNLASSMSEVLSHCQTILRDPSFVPIEEVQARDEEIAKLRIGWERMADRWKEAVTMMSQWKQKMLIDREQPHISDMHFDYQIDAEGLSGIADFGRSVAMRPDGQPVLDPIEEEELTSMLADHHSRILGVSAAHEEPRPEHSQLFQDETSMQPDETGSPCQASVQVYADEDFEVPAHEPLPTMASPARRGIKLSKSQETVAEQRRPLTNTNANSRKRKSTTTSSSPQKRRSPSSTTESKLDISRVSTKSSLNIDGSRDLSTNTTDSLNLDSLTSDLSQDEDDPSAPASEEFTDSKILRMTVAQKLAAVEAEASEATEVIRRRQATTYASDDPRARDRAKGVTKAPSKIVETNTTMTTGTKRREQHPAKSTERVKKTQNRRRSTLTPAELGSLMGAQAR